MLVGYGLTLALLFPIFHIIANAANPRLAAAMEKAPVRIENASCGYDPFAAKGQATECGRVLDYFAKQGVGYTKVAGEGTPRAIIGGRTVEGLQPEAFAEALRDAGYPGAVDPATGTWTVKSDPAERNDALIILAVSAMAILSGMTYGPVAAILVELFPARIRYTSMSIPYHIGSGYFGGFLPFVSQYIVVKSGNVFGGLWYTFAVVAVAFTVTLTMLPETFRRDVTK